MAEKKGKEPGKKPGTKKKIKKIWLYIGGGVVLLYLYMRAKGTTTTAAAAPAGANGAVGLGYNTPSTSYGNQGTSPGTDLTPLENQLSQLSQSVAGMQQSMVTQQQTASTTPTTAAQLGYTVGGSGGKSPALVTLAKQGQLSYTFARNGGGKGYVTVTGTKQQSQATPHGLFWLGVKTAKGAYVDHNWYTYQQFQANNYQEAGIAQSVKQHAKTGKKTG